MSVADALTVARYDLTNARRSRLVLGVVGLYVAIAALVFYGGSTASEPTVRQTLFSQVFVTALLLPLVAVAASYLAVAGERESETVTFLLSQPIRRRSVVLGKFLSRTVLVGVALLVAVGVGVAVVVATYPAMDLPAIATFFGLTLALVLVYVAVAVAISAASASRSRAISGAVGFYFLSDVLFLFGNVSIPGLLRYALEDIAGADLHPFFYAGFRALSPAVAYLNSTLAIFSPDNFERIQIPGELPFYLEPWFQVVILGAWVALAVVLGVLSFSRAEIA